MITQINTATFEGERRKAKPAKVKKPKKLKGGVSTQSGSGLPPIGDLPPPPPTDG